MLVRLMITTLGLGLWGASLWGMLLVSQMSASWEYAACGPWGCGPPAQALVSCQGFWLLMWAPPTVWLGRLLRAETLFRTGTLLALLAGGAILGIIIWQAVDWLPSVSEYHRGYFPQRCLFVISSLVDIPLVPALLSGMYLLAAWAYKKPVRKNPVSPDPSLSGASSTVSV